MRKLRFIGVLVVLCMYASVWTAAKTTKEKGEEKHITLEKGESSKTPKEEKSKEEIEENDALLVQSMKENFKESKERGKKVWAEEKKKKKKPKKHSKAVEEFEEFEVKRGMCNCW